MAKNSFRRIFLPTIKAITREIKALGFKRVSTAAVTYIDALRPRIADGVLTEEERDDLSRVGRAVMGDVTARITKDEASAIARTGLENGLGLSGTAANQVIIGIVKARKEGIAPEGIGVGADEDDPNDDVNVE